MSKERSKWDGVLLDHYYYIVKNKKHPTMAAWLVQFTDNPKYQEYVRQIGSGNEGSLSLLESVVSLPEGPDCKMILLDRVENIKGKFFDSHPQKSKLVLNGRGKRHSILAVQLNEEELFG